MSGIDFFAVFWYNKEIMKFFNREGRRGSDFQQLLQQSAAIMDSARTHADQPNHPRIRTVAVWMDNEGNRCKLHESTDTNLEKLVSGEQSHVTEYTLEQTYEVTGETMRFLFGTSEVGIYNWDSTKWVMYDNATQPVRINLALASLKACSLQGVVDSGQKGWDINKTNQTFAEIVANSEAFEKQMSGNVARVLGRTSLSTKKVRQYYGSDHKSFVGYMRDSEV